MSSFHRANTLQEEIASFQQRYQTSPKQAKKVMQMPQATPATESSLCKEMTSDEQVPAPQIIKAEPEGRSMACPDFTC